MPRRKGLKRLIRRVSDVGTHQSTSSGEKQLWECCCAAVTFVKLYICSTTSSSIS
jgi:hypothetical protein